MQRGICYACNYRTKHGKPLDTKRGRPLKDEVNTESVDSFSVDVESPAAKRHCKELAPPIHTEAQKQPLFQVIVCESWGAYDLSHLMVLWLPVAPEKVDAANQPVPVLEADTQLPDEFSSFQPLLEAWNKHVHVTQLSALKGVMEAETLDSPAQFAHAYSEAYYVNVVRFLACCTQQLDLWGDMLVNVQCGAKFDHNLHYVHKCFTLNVIHEKF